MSRQVDRDPPPHFPNRSGDPSSFASTATSTLVPNSVASGSPAPGDVTARQGDSVFSFAPLGMGMTPDLSSLPHSSFAPDTGRGEQPDTTPLAPAPGPPSNGSATDASSRTPFTEDPVVKETWKLAYHKYVEEQFPVGHYPDGRLELEDLNKQGVAVQLMTLRQRVDIVRRIRFVSETVQYEDYAKRRGPSLRDDLVALLENVANSLQVVIDLCYALPWPELAPQPPLDWVMLCIPEAGETYYSVAELGRAYRYAHDWIDSAASSVECMLILRPAGQFVRPPKKSNSAISRFALMGATPRAPSDDSSRAGSPAPALSRDDVEVRRVTIKTPPPIFRTPAHAAQALVTAEMVAAPRTPDRGLDEHIHEQYGDVSLFLQSAQRPLREAVIDANETMPLHADGFSSNAPPASQSFVSRQLPAVPQSTASVPQGVPSQYATLATMSQFPFNTPQRAAGGGGNLPPITPGQLDGAAPPPPNTPYGGPPPPNPFGFYASHGFPQPGGGGWPPVGSTAVPPSVPPGGGYGPPGGGWPPAGGSPGGGYGPPGGGPPAGGPPGGGAPPPAPPPPPPPNAGAADEPRFDMKFKADSLPQWDGNKRTAIDYFAKLQRWADLGGQIPRQIGALAPTRFTDQALEWWSTITEGARAMYGQSFHALVTGIRYAYLSESWSRKLIDYFNAMEFRDRYHERETPVQFLRRRTVLCNALWWRYSERDKVHQVLVRAPVEWLAVLNEHNVPSVDVLFRLATELEEQLTVAATGQANLKQLVKEYTLEFLRKPGAAPRQYVRRAAVDDPGRPALRQAPPAREAYYSKREDDPEELAHFDEDYQPGDLAAAEAPRESAAQNEANHLLVAIARAEGYLAERAKATSKTPRVYTFARDNRESPRLPPTPCRACGGPHWNKECRHWPAYEAQSRKGAAAMVANAGEPTEGEVLYDVAYAAYCSSKNDHTSFAYEDGVSRVDEVSEHGSGKGQDLRMYGSSWRISEEEDRWSSWYSDSPKLAAGEGPLLDEHGDVYDAYDDLDYTPSYRLPFAEEVEYAQEVSYAEHEDELVSVQLPIPTPRAVSVEEVPDRWHEWYGGTEKLLELSNGLIDDCAPHQSTYREASPTGDNPRRRGSSLVKYEPAIRESLLADINSTGRPPDARVSEKEDDYHSWYKSSLKATRFILEPEGDGYFETSERAILAAALSVESTLPPPIQREVRIVPKRSTPPGLASLGMSVLTARGRLGASTELPIALRLDSGASISLVSEDYLKRMLHPPKLRTGLKITLAQLTDQSPRIKGFVQLPVRVQAEDGTVLVFEAELYVVPGMTVEVLLGEDFQLGNELSILRSVDQGTRIKVGETGFVFEASSTTDGLNEAELRDVHMARALKVVLLEDPHFVRRKWHQRMRANRLRRKKALKSGALRAWKDVLIPAETTVRVPVAGDLQQDREWFVERFLIPQPDESFLTVPNTLLDPHTRDAGYAEPGSIGRVCSIPVSNPTKVPRILRVGTLLGYARDPQEYLDRAGTEERWEQMLGQASGLAALVRELDIGSDGQAESGPAADAQNSAAPNEDTPRSATMEAPGLQATSKLAEEARAREEGAPATPAATASDPSAPSQDDVTELEHPARAEAPDPADYPSDKMHEIIDIAPDAPPVYRERALELIKKHILAFGFDGRLGKLEANARVRVKEGTEPISEPMHGASPEKRRVIEDQLQKWFALDVIEPSRSPWAAPVVIVYRNGKARFCVDYRKLNAATIADEFPIPRQADILSALSGSQVLSSLDALAGFNQLDMAPEDVEKTAFRTHAGLFQFRRMPFGLRNGPAIFQRIMQGILAPYLWIFVLVYIDDIVIYSASYEEHLVHLDKVLGAIGRSGLTLSPNKCHFLYSSILLLGHKVSRLGLSTHQEKVSAITELERPTKLQSLQMFLGMVVYFQSFIPYYSFIVAPLFRLLRKGVKWEWGADEEHAFQEAKRALQDAPVLGHPVRGRPYRLYTDASDEALSACLQQVQDIRVGDLIGTPAYEKLKDAFEKQQPVPSFVSRISNKTVDILRDLVWGATLDDTVIETERVVSYWSRTFKSAERNYSATEREALAAKEALVKFQPFVEGEKIVLITDHSALQWARTFENANRRLASWGLVFGAHPGLEIVHRAGRLHSNVDPLSRLPRDPHTQRTRLPPEHVSPAKDTTPSIFTDVDIAELRERAASNAPAPRMAFANLAFYLSDLLEEVEAEANAVTRSQAKASVRDSGTSGKPAQPRTNAERAEQKRARQASKPLMETAGMRFEDALQYRRSNPPPTLQLVMDPETKARYVKGYASDPAFVNKGENSNERSWYAGNRFYKGQDGLLFFRDADFMPRLCVPRSEQAPLLKRTHESPLELAHAGPARSFLRLAERFYWPRMRKDIEEFCRSCDYCQKTKDANFARFGMLQPHLIPDFPYERISLDLVTGLPWAEGFNAILVIIDRLTKHAQFIPTDTGLDSVKFAELFIRQVVCRFGVPSEIVADRDGRWLSHFFTEVARQLKTHMLLSSSHHPQHDGQTERVNRTMETMLRSYAAQDTKTWPTWLPALEFAYNNTPHASTGETPYFLLYGCKPRSPVDLLVPQADGDAVQRGVTAHKGADSFLEQFESHRLAARDAMAMAQHAQAQAYNRGRRELELEPGDLVLLRPKGLELVETKGEGAKLMQKAIGPFAVQERVGDATYRIDLPSTFQMSNVIHMNHLRRYVPSPERFGERSQMRPPRWDQDAVQEYQVERIVAHRRNRRRGQMEYLVRWEGFGPGHDDWLTAHELRNAPARLLDYRRHHGI